MDENIKVIKIKREISYYRMICPKCNTTLTATTIKLLNHNYKQHKEACDKK